MESHASKLSVWTVGLDEEWKLSAGPTTQIDRGFMHLSKVEHSIERIRAFNGDTVDCQLGLRYQNTQLYLSIVSGKIIVSDPDDMNYQGVEVLPSELVSYLETHFQISEDAGEISSNPVRLIEWCVLGTFLLMLGCSIFYANRFLNSRFGFLPIPDTVEFDNRDVRTHMERYSGIYITRVQDGGMAIELSPEGAFGYYDLAKISPTVYRMSPVNKGKYRPVLINGRISLITTNRFVFTPSGKAEVEFLHRKFEKVGKSRADVPYMDFPDQP